MTKKIENFHHLLKPKNLKQLKNYVLLLQIQGKNDQNLDIFTELSKPQNWSKLEILVYYCKNQENLPNSQNHKLFKGWKILFSTVNLEIFHKRLDKSTNLLKHKVFLFLLEICVNSPCLHPVFGPPFTA
jgi:hypothetical protein